MEGLSENYWENVSRMDAALRVEQNFDLIKKTLYLGQEQITMYYIDGFVASALVLSGTALILGETFGAYGIIVDSRTYPTRSVGEPENDRVMVGSRDGFVETLVFNTALIRRRVRDPHLTMQYFTIGRCSRTDVVLCYMEGQADPKYVAELQKKLKQNRKKYRNLLKLKQRKK